MPAFTTPNTPTKPNPSIARLLAAFLLALLISAPSGALGADTEDPGKEFGKLKYEYAVKFICGWPDYPVAAPGEYFTAINVHNPNEAALIFRKKVAVALPREKAGPVSRFFAAKLKYDEALEIDCPDIMEHAGSKKRFLKGFVVIQSALELDVVAVYTAGERHVQTLHIERVPYRTIAKPQIVKAEPEQCPPGNLGDRVGREGCCCNKPKPSGGYWPDCAPGLMCLGNLQGPGIPTNTFSVCAARQVPGVSPPIHWSQPSFCGR